MLYIVFLGYYTPFLREFQLKNGHLIYMRCIFGFLWFSGWNWNGFWI